MSIELGVLRTICLRQRSTIRDLHEELDRAVLAIASMQEELEQRLPPIDFSQKQKEPT